MNKSLAFGVSIVLTGSMSFAMSITSHAQVLSKASTRNRSDDQCRLIYTKFMDKVETLKKSTECRKILAETISGLEKTNDCKNLLEDMRVKGPSTCNALGRE